MQLGKTLIGAIIGAALGIGLMVLINLLFHLDAVWLAIPVAILTGLGVRTLVSTSGHASYLRGAITGVLALAAYLGGQYVVKEVATNFATSKVATPKPSATERSAEDDEGTDGSAETPVPVPERPIAQAPRGGGDMRKAVAPGQNPLDYIWLGVAALVAYELGRGTGPKTVAATGPAPVDAPMGTHPDA